MDRGLFESEFYSGVVDGFFGACDRLLRVGQSDAALWLLVDHILLLFQSSAYVNVLVRRQDTFKLVFSSLPHQDRAFLGLPGAESEAESFKETFHVVNSDQSLAIAVYALPTARPAASGDPLCLLDSEMCRKTKETIFQLLNRFSQDRSIDLRGFSWRHYVGKSATCRDSTSMCIPRQSDVAKLRLAVGSVLDSVGKSRLTQSATGSGTNLFAVVRYPTAPRVVDPPKTPLESTARSTRSRVEYDYSLKLLLSPEQCRWLAQHHENPEALSVPLPNGARSIADTPIAQGNVDFSLPNERIRNLPGSRQYYPGRGGDGKARLLSEDILYRLAFDDETPKGDETLFYVPIHLSGIPWLAFFTFNRGSRDTHSMMRNYHLYRDLIPLLSESVSIACQGAFAESLAESATTAFEDTRGRVDFIEATNEVWRSIAGLYPYGTPTLNRDGSPSDKLDVEMQYPLYLSFTSIEEVLPYRRLDMDRVRTAISHALQRAALRLRSVYQHLYKDALFVFGHQAGKLFQESGLAGFVPADNRASQRMKNRLFLAWGMAEAIRTLKYEQEGLPKDWFDLDESGRVSATLSDATQAVFQVCRFYIAGAASALDPRLPIRFQTEGVQQDLTVADTGSWLHQEFESLPPLKCTQDGQLGTLALTFGLAELIRNALHHVLTNAAELLSALLDDEIRGPVFELSASAVDSDTLRVTIRNRKWGGDKLRVETLRRIQDIERAVFSFNGKPFVETGSPEDEPGSGDITWAVATWEFKFGRILQMVESWKTTEEN